MKAKLVSLLLYSTYQYKYLGTIYSVLCQDEVEYSHLRHFCGDLWGGGETHLACSLASTASSWSQGLLAGTH